MIFNFVAEHAGIVGIIRNATGHLLGAFACKVKVNHSIEAELLALLTGVDLCIKMGLTAVILEGECLILVESLSNCKNLQWSFMHEQLEGPRHPSQTIAVMGNQVLQANNKPSGECSLQACSSPHDSVYQYTASVGPRSLSL